MKKLLSASGFTHSVLFAFKGIYIVFLLILSTSSSFAQVVKKDTSTFNKWEISLDLKPLFRKDEPYNVFVKRHLTKRKSLRIGFSTVLTETSDSISYFQNSVITGRRTYTYNLPYEVKKIQYGIFLGFVYEKDFENLVIYSATDLFFNKNNTKVTSTTSGTFRSEEVLNPLEFFYPTGGFNNIQKYGLKQSIGIKFSFMKNVSISIEVSAQYFRIEKHFAQNFEDSRDLKNLQFKYFDEQTKSFDFSFQPIGSIFLNYQLK